MNAETEFERLAAMLPFYINGTLDETGRRQIEIALAYSAELRARLVEERELAAGVISDTEAGLAGSGDTSEGRLSQMMSGLPQSLAGDTSRVPLQQGGGGGAGDGAGLNRALSFLNPRRWNPAAVLGAGVLGLGGVAGWQATMINRLQAANYELLAGELGEQQAGGIVVEFAADAQWDAITGLLDAEGLVFASSSPFGVVILKNSAASGALAEQVGRLRASPLIASADPAA